MDYLPPIFFSLETKVNSLLQYCMADWLPYQNDEFKSSG